MPGGSSNATIRYHMAKPLEIDAEQVRKLAAINCTMIEIASVVGCSVDTLERRFADVIKEGRAHGRSSLRRHMWEAVQKGNITMMIWLSKNILGYGDRVINETQSENEETKRLIINMDGKPEDLLPKSPIDERR